MSRTAFPYGMVPALAMAAGYNSQGFETFEIVDAYATSIFFGDVVKLAASGTIQKDTGTATLTPWGIFLGCRYVLPSLGYVVDAQCWPASLATGAKVYAKVLTDPNAVFQIQADATLDLTSLGKNAGIVQTAGSLSIGKSRNALAASTVATTSTLPLRIVNKLDVPDNDWGDAFPQLLVRFNGNQQLLSTTGI